MSDFSLTVISCQFLEFYRIQASRELEGEMEEFVSEGPYSDSRCLPYIQVRKEALW